MILSSGGGKVADLDRVARSATGYRSGGYGITGAYAGRSVTRETAMGLAPFWSGVMLLAKTAGTLPLETINRAQANEVISAAGVAKRLRYQPNPETPASVFWSTVFANLVPSGNAYLLKLPATDGLYVPELYWLPSELVQVYRGPDGERRYDIYAAGGGEFASAVHHRHIIHLRGPSIDDPLVGASPVQFLRHALGNALAAQEYQGAMYRQGGQPKGLLSVEEPLSPEQAATIRDQWHATYGGIENAGKIAVLDRGAKFQPTATNMRDAQFIEQQQMSATDAARILNLPPALIAAEGASLTYANASHNDEHFLKFSLRPWLDYAEQGLNMDTDLFGVSSPWEPRFNTDEISRPTQGERYDNYGKAIAAGWMDSDEVRPKEGLPPRPAGAAPQGDAGAKEGSTDEPA
jgi:HK97 family phage portal protein